LASTDEPVDLTSALGPPRWLRNLGSTAWLLVGVALFLVGAVWLMSLTQSIVVPVIMAAVIAAVASPLVGWLKGHRVPRAAGAALVLLGIVAVGVLTFVMVVAGIASQTDDFSAHLDDATTLIQGWLRDIGVSGAEAQEIKETAGSAARKGVEALLGGLSTGVTALSSLVVFLAFTTLSLFFLLKDGPTIRGWVEGHLGVPPAVARSISTRTLESLRGYFLGLTLIAVFNAVIVLVGALLLGVPLAGAIAAVTFIAAYIPYIGAWAAAVFAVLVALGGAGTDAATGMIVVQLLANTVLQQVVQPFAMGTALGIHPLAVLIVTIAGGSVFGAVGLILAAPLTSAVVRISADLTRPAVSAAPAG